MSIEENIKQKIESLIDRSQDLKTGDPEYGNAQSDDQRLACSAWISSALYVVQLICTDPQNAYRAKAEKIAARASGWVINHDVGEFSYILQELRDDIENGLLASVADRARAETFDNFLDHAKEYLKLELKNEAGVIAGVVFEDTLRRICRKNGKNDKDEQLDSLINHLAKIGVLTQAKAKRARAAAHVRTKATHAQWDEFEIDDVQTTINFTEQLILNHLDE